MSGNASATLDAPAAPAPANPQRGEAALLIGGVLRLLRPTFAALVAAEAELGSLFRFVEVAAGGEARLAEVATLLWHCLVDRDQVARDALGDALVEMGLAAVAPVLRAVLGQILRGL